MSGDFALLSYFQALGIALEGTYSSGEVKEKVPLKKRPFFPKSSGRMGGKATNTN